MTRDRSEFIGGSDIAKILGLSNWGSEYSVYHEKVNGKSEFLEHKGAKVKSRGKIWEPVVRKMLIQELKSRGHKVKVLQVNQRYDDPEYSFLSCEIDLEILLDDEEVNVEIKTVHPNAAKDWGIEGTDQIPKYYICQVMFGLMIRPKKRTLAVALIGVDDLRIHFIDREEELISMIRVKALEFKKRLDDKNPPCISCDDDIKLKYPNDDGSAIEASEGIIDLIRQRQSLNEQTNLLLEEIHEIDLHVKDFMGEAAKLTFGENEVSTFKLQKRKGFTTTDTEFRVLRYK